MSEEIREFEEDADRESLFSILKSVWISMIAILFLQFDYLDDEIHVLASRRRYWVTAISAVGFSWLMISAGQVASGTIRFGTPPPLNLVAFQVVWNTIGLFWIPLLLFLLATALSGFVFERNDDAHQQAVAIVLMIRTVAFAVSAFIGQIIWAKNVGLPYLTLEGYQTASEPPAVVAIKATIALLIFGLAYVLLIKSLRIAHEDASNSRIAVGLVIVTLIYEGGAALVSAYLERLVLFALFHDALLHLFGL